MEITQVICTIKQTDCIDKNETILFQGNASFKPGYLSYQDNEGKQEFIYDKVHMEIVRNATTKTKVNLLVGELSEASFESEFGEMCFETRVEFFEVKEYSWAIEYIILSGDVVSLHTRIECQILENENEN